MAPFYLQQRTGLAQSWNYNTTPLYALECWWFNWEGFNKTIHISYQEPSPDSAHIWWTPSQTKTWSNGWDSEDTYNLLIYHKSQELKIPSQPRPLSIILQECAMNQNGCCLFGVIKFKPWTNGKCLATNHHQTLFDARIILISLFAQYYMWQRHWPVF